MKVEIDPSAGFCGGVQRAIRKAEEAATGDGSVFSLGELVHNEREVERLRRKGVDVINCERLKELSSGTVLIRAHGEPPSTYRMAEAQKLKLIDATCPIVRKLQQKVSDAAGMVREAGGTILLYGKKGHPELKGLEGYAGGLAVSVQTAGELEDKRLSPPVYLFSQTTMSREGFEEVAAALQERFGAEQIAVNDSICGQVYGRGPHLREFARANDVIVFVSGKKSSNGRYLFGICKEANPNSYFVGGPDEVDQEWFEGAVSVGISGAASTPLDDLFETAKRIEGN